MSCRCHHHPHHPTADIEMSSAAELPSEPERFCGCRGGWRRLRRAAAAARSPERRRRRCGAAAYEQRNGDAGVAVATCRSSRARPSSPYPAACASRRRRCGLLHLHRGGAQPGRRRRPQAISYTVRSGRLDALALLLLLAADIPHGERRRAVWRRAPGRVPAGRGGDGVGAPRPRHAGGARQPVLRTGTCSPGRWWLFNSDHWTLISEAATRQMVEDNAVNLSALCLLACRLINQQENARRRCLPTRVWSRRCRPAQHADRVHRRRRRLPRSRRSSRLQRSRRRRCRRSHRRMPPSSRGCRRESRWRDASGPYAFVGAAGERRRRVRRGRQRGRGA
nr:uncharacterized protein LOC107278348 [Oryza sativa Japonica Group]